MLQRLRSRHPIDLPRGAWQRKKGILAILGGTAVMFVLIPLALSPLVALSESARKALILLAAGLGTLLFVLFIGGVRGKFGWDR